MPELTDMKADTEKGKAALREVLAKTVREGIDKKAASYEVRGEAGVGQLTLRTQGRG